MHLKKAVLSGVIPALLPESAHSLGRLNLSNTALLSEQTGTDYAVGPCHQKFQTIPNHTWAVNPAWPGISTYVVSAADNQRNWRTANKQTSP